MLRGRGSLMKTPADFLVTTLVAYLTERMNYYSSPNTTQIFEDRFCGPRKTLYTESADSRQVRLTTCHQVGKVRLILRP